MVGERSVPNAEGSDIVGSAIWSLTCEAFMITIAFMDSTVAKDNTRADNTRISVEVVSQSICPSKWCKVVCSENLVRILVVIVSLFDGRRKCVVVEDVSRGGGGETHRGRYGSGRYRSGKSG